MRIDGTVLPEAREEKDQKGPKQGQPGLTVC